MDITGRGRGRGRGLRCSDVGNRKIEFAIFVGLDENQVYVIKKLSVRRGRGSELSDNPRQTEEGG